LRLLNVREELIKEKVLVNERSKEEESFAKQTKSDSYYS
jgi:hypothetical protein